MGWGSGQNDVGLIADVSPYTAGILSEQQGLQPIIGSDWYRLNSRGYQTIRNLVVDIWFEFQYSVTSVAGVGRVD